MGEADVDRELGEVLDELIDAVLETKQAVWSSPPGPVHRELEELRAFLVERAQAVADAEERIAGRAPGIASVAGRRPANLRAEAGDGAVVGLLGERLRRVADDVRARGARIAGEGEAGMLDELADGLSRRVERLEDGPGAAQAGDDREDEEELAGPGDLVT